MFENDVRVERSFPFGLVGAQFAEELRLLAALIAQVEGQRGLLLVHASALRTQVLLQLDHRSRHAVVHPRVQTVLVACGQRHVVIQQPITVSSTLCLQYEKRSKSSTKVTRQRYKFIK